MRSALDLGEDQSDSIQTHTPCSIELQQGVIIMTGSYEIKNQGKTVGRVEVTKQGLYYHISCRCDPPGGGMQRLILRTGESRTDLGICVPENGSFVVRKRIPCKTVTGENPTFILESQNRRQMGRFVIPDPDMPFPELSNLSGAILERREGKLGILIDA